MRIDDVPAVSGAAQQLRASATTLDQIACRVQDIDFVAARAGRDYGPDGAAVADGLHKIGRVVQAWSHAAEACGAALASTVARVQDTDRWAADGIDRAAGGV